MLDTLHSDLHTALLFYQLFLSYFSSPPLRRNLATKITHQKEKTKEPCSAATASHRLRALIIAYGVLESTFAHGAASRERPRDHCREHPLSKLASATTSGTTFVRLLTTLVQLIYFRLAFYYYHYYYSRPASSFSSGRKSSCCLRFETSSFQRVSRLQGKRGWAAEGSVEFWWVWTGGTVHKGYT
jgi:hypothetical protein